METLTRSQRYRINNPVAYKETRVKFNIKRNNNRLEKRTYVQEFKIKKGCEKCGYKKHHSALQFDHINRDDKEYNVSTMVLDHSLEDIKKEISKCRVLCANCHAEKTYDNKEWINNE